MKFIRSFFIPERRNNMNIEKQTMLRHIGSKPTKSGKRD